MHECASFTPLYPMLSPPIPPCPSNHPLLNLLSLLQYFAICVHLYLYVFTGHLSATTLALIYICSGLDHVGLGCPGPWGILQDPREVVERMKGQETQEEQV